MVEARATGARRRDDVVLRDPDRARDGRRRRGRGRPRRRRWPRRTTTAPDVARPGRRPADRRRPAPGPVPDWRCAATGCPRSTRCSTGSRRSGRPPTRDAPRRTGAGRPDVPEATPTRRLRHTARREARVHRLRPHLPVRGRRRPDPGPALPGRGPRASTRSGMGTVNAHTACGVRRARAVGVLPGHRARQLLGRGRRAVLLLADRPGRAADPDAVDAEPRQANHGGGDRNLLAFSGPGLALPMTSASVGGQHAQRAPRPGQRVAAERHRRRLPAARRAGGADDWSVARLVRPVPPQEGPRRLARAAPGEAPRARRWRRCCWARSTPSRLAPRLDRAGRLPPPGCGVLAPAARRRQRQGGRNGTLGNLSAPTPVP